MIDIPGLKAQISELLHRFPSVEGELLRPVFDAYGQPTDEVQSFGLIELWWRTPEMGEKLGIDEKGQAYAEDGPRWVCALMTDDLPEAQRNDLVLIDGKMWRVANREKRIARVFWQLVPEAVAEVSGRA